jgi:2-octaprenyl-6-methoxyphenol hydroxylase
MPLRTALHIAVIGAGPVGLALALQAARLLPQARLSLYDARPLQRDVAGDPRTLALALGSVQLLQHLDAWPEAAAAAITEVHVSQQSPGLAALLPGALAALGAAEVRLRAGELGVPRLGAVLSYGALVAALQAAWLQVAAAEPARLQTRFGTPVAALKAVPGGVEIDAGVAETVDLAVVAEGGVYSEQLARSDRGVPSWARGPLQHDYGQTAWVGNVTLQGATPGRAFERFTRHGPAALLPLPTQADGATRSALVWCVRSDDDPVRELNDAQRLAVLATIFPPEAGRPVALSPLKDFALGLHAEPSLVDGRVVRIGNAAQTLHPVAGQGLNLGLRDAYALVNALRWADDVDTALRRVRWQRGPDRWATIATTDFLARSFTWQLPGAAALRGLGLAALQATPPLKGWLARQMMFGLR